MTFRSRILPLGLAILLAPSVASANGRFPESNQVVFSASEPDLVLLRMTFGLLVSHDRGRTFDWICEPSIGYGGFEDPMYAVAPSGAWIASTFQGITKTTDRGCTWRYATDGLDDAVFTDLAADPSKRSRLVVLSSLFAKRDDAGVATYSTDLYETNDEGGAFVRLGPPFDERLLAATVDLVAGDPDRIYVSATRSPGPQGVGVLLTSKDHGKTWSEELVPFLGEEYALYIAAVDPRDPEKVYLRTHPAAGKPSRLLLRDETTIKTLFDAQVGLSAFALSEDGARVWIGSPLDGIHVASTTDHRFTKRSALATKCLAVTAEGLWACSDDTAFSLGLSRDDGATFEPRLRFCEIRGPLACPQGSLTSNLCPPLWPAQRSALGCAVDAGAPPPLDAAVDANVVAPVFSAGGSGCDCGTTPAPASWTALATTAAAAIALLTRTLRRGRGAPSRRRRGPPAV